MGERSGGHPSVDQSFVERLLHALNLTYSDLAQEIAPDNAKLRNEVIITLREWANASPSKLPAVDRDVVWFKILEYIDRQYAYLMAAKHELNSLLVEQRAYRALRSIQQQALAGTSAPYSLPRRTR